MTHTKIGVGPAEDWSYGRIVVPFNGHVIGEGFNSDTVERVGVALDVATVGEDPRAPGQTAVLDILAAEGPS